MPADYYELLGVARDASSDDIKRAFRRLRSRAASRREPRLARSRGAVQGGRARVRECSRTPSGVSATTGSVPKGVGARRAVTRASAGSATSSTRSSAAAFGGGSRGPSGPPRGSDLEVVVDLDFEEAVFGAQAPVTVRTAVPCDVCEAAGAAEAPRRSRAPSAAAPARCAGSASRSSGRWSPRVRARGAAACGEVIAAPCPTCRGEGRADRGAHLHRRHPGRRRQRVDAAADAGAAPWARGAARPATSTSTCGCARTTASRATATTSSATFRRVHPGRPRRALTFDTLDGTEDLVVPAGTQTGRVFRLRGRGVPTSTGAAAATCSCACSVETPTDLSREEEDLLRQLAELRGEEVAPAETGLFSKIRSAFK